MKIHFLNFKGIRSLDKKKALKLLIKNEKPTIIMLEETKLALQNLLTK
jgi:exonuclease III